MRRPKFLIFLSALVIAAVIIFWPGSPPGLHDSKVEEAPQPPPAPKLVDYGKPADIFYSSTSSTTIAAPEIDSANLQRASLLNSPDQSVQDDLQIIADFVQLLDKAGLNYSVGDNADITAALTGTQYAGQKGHVFPRQHNAIRSGQLVDRWGTPFWFHANGPQQLEIRSAGPDRELFTTDDITRNPSPAGLGVTPPQQP